MRWPIREALEAFRMLLRREALRDYRHRVKVFASQAAWLPKGTRPPELPAILKEISRAR